MSTAAERLARVTARALLRFAEPAQLNGAEVRGIFESAYQGDTFGQLVAENFGPTFTCLSADAPREVHGAPLVVTGVTYRVIQVMPDGNGVTVLRLERA